MKQKQKAFCFSPPVMLATFSIEFLGALYVAWRYRASRTTRLAIAILICLGVFQLAEYLICEAPALPGLTWARIGFVSITMLPPLGISLAMSIAGKRNKIAELLPFIAAVIFNAYFIFADGALSAETCAGNYVIFNSASSLMPYAIYYYGLLIIGTAFCFFTRERTADKKTKSALLWLAIGYLSFLLPTTTVNLIDRSTIAAIPSIMCGFAVLLALVLIFAVIPKSAELRHPKTTKD